MTLFKQYPPSIIDVEASGFGAKSFPIEVGVVRYDGAKICRLIRPLDEWAHWDESAEALHGISRSNLLSHGNSPVQVCRELNEFLGNTVVYSDGWVVDHPWLIKLFAAASMDMTFSCRALDYLLSEDQMALWHDVKDDIVDSLNVRRHRASSDAMVIQQTFIETKRLSTLPKSDFAAVAK